MTHQYSRGSALTPTSTPPSLSLERFPLTYRKYTLQPIHKTLQYEILTKAISRPLLLFDLDKAIEQPLHLQDLVKAIPLPLHLDSFVAHYPNLR